ncbi:MAG: ParA family protein, partial [Promethearchaeota archaeon]
MKTIAFVSYKGGAGKSVLAANVATYLALEQK